MANRFEGRNDQDNQMPRWQRTEDEAWTTR